MSRINVRPPRRLPLGIIVLVLVAVLSGGAGGWLQSHRSATDLGTQRQVATSQGRLISQIARQDGVSVVSIDVSLTDTSTSALSRYYGDSGSQTALAAGTGIIISNSGLIITNRHVVPSTTTKVSITLSDGTELDNVSVVGRTSDSDPLDVAFLKINDMQGHKLTAARLGDSSKVQVGDGVVAIGNALGQFQNTVTSGIISGFGRSVQAGDSSDSTAASENLNDLFQTDAAINEGNSGGPLVNLNGEVIGINTAIAGDAQSIGFAIPINDVRGLINQVIQTGKFARPYLGVRYVPITPDVATAYKLSASNGAYILPSDEQGSSVLADGPAAKAGIHEKDIITKVDDTKVDQTHSLSSLLGVHQPGETVELSILRAGKTIQLDVKLGSLPGA